MKQAYLIAYDITDNRFRTKMADQLISIGMERVQWSVFMGTVKIKKINDFSLWFQKESVTFASSDKDSLLILNVSVNQLSQIRVFGPKFIDIEMLTDNKLTLII
ncbi:MAG: associated protein Cas2 [Bacteroidota bacterium]